MCTYVHHHEESNDAAVEAASNDAAVEAASNDN
jgi:hypothetical protein